MRKRSTASITARIPAIFGFKNNETNPKMGSNKSTIMKNPANARVRISFIRVSDHKGVNRKPIIIPNTNKTANIRSAFPKVVLDDENNFFSQINLYFQMRVLAFFILFIN
ncbi:MAG: hypothetical protein ACXVH2_10910 [Methanobacterium sp.]